MNKEKFEFLGINKFHETGFYGKGIKIGNIESKKRTHSKKVEDILRQIVPESEIISNIKYWEDEVLSLGLDGYTCSQKRADSKELDNIIKAKELYNQNVFMTCSIGNDYDIEYSKLAEQDEWASVGACNYNKR